MPLASDDAEIIPELSAAPGMLRLMTDAGCHGAAGITVIDSRLRLIQVPSSACIPVRVLIPAAGFNSQGCAGFYSELPE